jgi:hypothetical protein
VDIHIPSGQELRERFGSSRAGAILSLVGFVQFVVWAIGKLLAWKSTIEEAQMTAHQLSPFLGVMVSIVTSPWFGLTMMALGYCYIAFVPSNIRPRSQLIATISVWLACGVAVAGLFTLAVFAVSMKLTGITPFEVARPNVGSGYLERVAITIPAGYNSLVPGKPIAFNVYFMNPTQIRIFNAIDNVAIFLSDPLTVDKPVFDELTTNKLIISKFKLATSQFRKDFWDGKLSGSELGAGQGLWYTVGLSPLTQAQYQDITTGRTHIYLLWWTGWTLSPSPKSQKDSTEECVWLQPPTPAAFQSNLLAWHACG